MTSETHLPALRTARLAASLCKTIPQRERSGEEAAFVALKYPGEWKFEGIGFAMPIPAVNEFLKLLLDVAENSRTLLDEFKAAFGSPYPSSSFDWAVTDLTRALERRAENAAAFVDAVWNCLTAAEARGITTPSVAHLNRMLSNHGVPLAIEPPHLRKLTTDVVISAEPQPEMSPSEAMILPHFRLGEIVGSGGYGTVYRATRSTAITTFDFAIKLLDPTPFVQNRDKATLRFAREIQAMQSLQHRGIVQLIEAGIAADGRPYLVMPLITGDDLRAAAQRLAMRSRLSLFCEILDSLAYAHANDVIHRDLKPTNILVRESDGQPIVLDFGASYRLDDLDAASLTSQAVGTIGYIPSEVIADPKKRSPLQDIYACGVMLYETFAGSRPDPANYSSLVRVSSQYGALDAIIQQAIAGEMGRIGSAAEFASMLRAVDC